MGRYPWLETSKEYMKMRKGFIADTTYEEWQRKLRHINRILVDLRRDGKISTTSPEKLKREDIAAFLKWGEAKGIQASTMEKYVMLMEKITGFAGNPVFEKLRAMKENLPRRTPKDLRSLDEDELKQITDKAEETPGWYGEIARFLVAMYPYSGLRPSELRESHVEDIDIKRWCVFVRHPKGERRYARQRHAPILPPARNAVIRFLDAREERLKTLGFKDAIPLIPAKHGGEIGFYSSGRFREIKKMIRVPGIKFSLKTFRDTFCQMNLDRDPTLLSDVSSAMGHATTRTTEMHYGRLKNEQALDRLQRSWQQASAINRLIDDRIGVTG